MVFTRIPGPINLSISLSTYHLYIYHLYQSIHLSSIDLFLPFLSAHMPPWILLLSPLCCFLLTCLISKHQRTPGTKTLGNFQSMLTSHEIISRSIFKILCAKKIQNFEFISSLFQIRPKKYFKLNILTTKVMSSISHTQNFRK